MHVLLLRHGQTDENARGILQGHAQTRLNALGHEQARCLAERLRDYVPRVEALVSSDLRRAVETAGPVAHALGLRLEQRAAWRERGFGPFEGRAIGEAEVWRAATGSWDLPGAEPTESFRTRVRSALLDTVRDHPAVYCVAVITHGATIRTVLNLLREGPLQLAPDAPAPESVPIANCAILHLEIVDRQDEVLRWHVRCVNDAAHLATGVGTFQVEE